MSKFGIENINGVISAMLSVFDEHENVDIARTKDLVEFQLRLGVQGFYLTGSTGEAFMMDASERNRIIKAVVEQVNGRVPVIAHVGDISTKKSIDLARHARNAGVDAISSVPPFYWRFSDEDILSYYRDIANATELPMIIYNIELAGIMPEELLIKLAGIENIKGLKYTARTHDEMAYIKHRLGDGFMVYSGCDEMALSGVIFGADGIIGSFYNVIPDIYLRICESLAANDMQAAARYQKIAAFIIRETLRYDFLSAMRVLLGWRGADAGYSRRPFAKYHKDELEDLRKSLIEIGRRFDAEDVPFFKEISK